MHTKLALIFVCIFTGFHSLAHDVVWPGNPLGVTTNEPLRLDFPGGVGLVQVQPVFGEDCIVAVNLDMLASTLIKAEIVTENPALQVEIRITVLRAPTATSEVVQVTGEWHATGVPDPDECTATEPNRFVVPVQVARSQSAPVISGITPASAPAGSNVTVAGSGFTGASQVQIGGQPAEFTVDDDGTLRVIAPAGGTVGKLTVVTPNGMTSSDSPFVVLPVLNITSATGGEVQVSWGNPNYPFTLERTDSLTDPAWSEVIRTVDNRVTLPVGGSPAFFRLVWLEIPLDPTDYNRDRASVAQFYHRDPVDYWATHGVPALARLAIFRQQVGTDPFQPFQGFMQGFNEGRFFAALENNQLPAPFAALATNELASGSSATNAYLNSFIKLVQQSDASTNCPSLFRTNCVVTNSFVPVFTQVMTNTISTNGWTTWAPQTNKVFINPAQQTNHATINWVDVHGSDAFTTNRRPATAPNDDTNTTFTTQWENISTPTLWNTTYDGACASVAVGASLAKLGVGPTNTTCRFWNELSRLLGSTPGVLGAYQTNIAALYGSLGYGCNAAYDGPFESAVEEAKKALERGCDVAITYISPDRTRAHTEMVLGITVSAADSTKGTISTLSWGQNATVNYSGSVTGGSYSGKSDGQRYRKSTETTSYLEGTGTSIIHYYCKK